MASSSNDTAKLIEDYKKAKSSGQLPPNVNYGEYVAGNYQNSANVSTGAGDQTQSTVPKTSSGAPLTYYRETPGGYSFGTSPTYTSPEYAKTISAPAEKTISAPASTESASATVSSPQLLSTTQSAKTGQSAQDNLLISLVQQKGNTVPVTEVSSGYYAKVQQAQRDVEEQNRKINILKGYQEGYQQSSQLSDINLLTTTTPVKPELQKTQADIKTAYETKPARFEPQSILQQAEDIVTGRQVVRVATGDSGVNIGTPKQQQQIFDATVFIGGSAAAGEVFALAAPRVVGTVGGVFGVRAAQAVEKTGEFVFAGIGVQQFGEATKRVKTEGFNTDTALGVVEVPLSFAIMGAAAPGKKAATQTAERAALMSREFVYGKTIATEPKELFSSFKGSEKTFTQTRENKLDKDVLDIVSKRELVVAQKGDIVQQVQVKGLGKNEEYILATSFDTSSRGIATGKGTIKDKEPLSLAVSGTQPRQVRELNVGRPKSETYDFTSEKVSDITKLKYEKQLFEKETGISIADVRQEVNIRKLKRPDRIGEPRSDFTSFEGISTETNPGEVMSQFEVTTGRSDIISSRPVTIETSPQMSGRPIPKKVTVFGKDVYSYQYQPKGRFLNDMDSTRVNITGTGKSRVLDANTQESFVLGESRTEKAKPKLSVTESQNGVVVTREFPDATPTKTFGESISSRNEGQGLVFNQTDLMRIDTPTSRNIYSESTISAKTSFQSKPDITIFTPEIVSARGEDIPNVISKGIFDSKKDLITGKITSRVMSKENYVSGVESYFKSLTSPREKGFGVSALEFEKQTFKSRAEPGSITDKENIIKSVNNILGEKKAIEQKKIYDKERRNQETEQQFEFLDAGFEIKAKKKTSLMNRAEQVTNTAMKNVPIVTYEYSRVPSRQPSPINMKPVNVRGYGYSFGGKESSQNKFNLSSSPRMNINSQIRPSINERLVNRNLSNNDTANKLKDFTNNEFDLTSRSDEIIKIKIEDRIKPSIKERLQSQQITAQDTRLKFDLQYEFVKPVETRPDTKIRDEFGFPRARFPRFDFDTKKDYGEDQGAFDVYVRERKKLIKVNTKPQSFKAAENLGGYYTDNTPTKTFTLKRSAGVVGKPETSYSFNPNKYKQKSPSVFIEKSKYAIDTPGEVQGITVKGLMARKKRFGAFGI